MLIRVFLILFTIVFLLNLYPNFVFAAKDNEIYQTLLNSELVLKERGFAQEGTPTVYLTFDDGPSELTPKVLDILENEGIKATFFVLGQNAIQYKEVLNRIVEEGHAIGNHTYSHQYNKIYRSFSVFWEEVQKTEEIIYNITGTRTHLLRAPGGTHHNFDSFYFYYLDQADYLVYDWNVDSGDSSNKNVSSEQIISIVKQTKFKNKLIVLLHDGQGHQSTIDALPEIIRYYKSKGYQFKAITEEVKPITQPLASVKWKRDNEFAKREHFIRSEYEYKKVAKTIKINISLAKKEKILLKGNKPHLQDIVYQKTFFNRIKEKNLFFISIPSSMIYYY